MKFVKRLAALTACLLAFTLVLTGCSIITSILGPKYETLEECFADPEIKEQVDAEVESAIADSGLSDMYSNVEARAEDNVLIYDYTYADAITFTDECQRRAWYNTFIDEIEPSRSQFEEIAADLDESLNLEGITVQLIYRNTDGTELMAYDYANPPAKQYYADIAECVSDPAVAQRLVDEFGFDQFTGTATGEGNTLIYNLTFNEQWLEPGYTVDDAAVDLAAFCEDNMSAFTIDFDELRAVVDADPIAIRYAFFDIDGTPLYVHEFTDTAGTITSNGEAVSVNAAA